MGNGTRKWWKHNHKVDNYKSGQLSNVMVIISLKFSKSNFSNSNFPFSKIELKPIGLQREDM